MKQAYENYLSVKAKHPGNTKVDVSEVQKAVDSLVEAVGVEVGRVGVETIRPTELPVRSVSR